MMTALVFFFFTWQINRKVSPLSPFVLGLSLAPSICVSLSLPSCCSLRKWTGHSPSRWIATKKAFSCYAFFSLVPCRLCLFVPVYRSLIRPYPSERRRMEMNCFLLFFFKKKDHFPLKLPLTFFAHRYREERLLLYLISLLSS
ncbi:hypothetical protein EDB82DRAFT_78609 [Fusarium venenatum]|uniref:uncharacterized protein n=1 Tax=Fusarium venenatum TaxID=56646 RepID=UPI001DEE3FB6|nr:hypothetical protein EDB82DRAFT_78609 [Fusarium venenatum]